MKKKTSKPEQMVERWDLKALSMTDATDVQSALEEGYEPFSVSTLIRKPDSSLALAGKNEMTTETVIWMKRRHMVPVVSEGLATVTTLEPNK
jgi:hypothetical protein